MHITELEEDILVILCQGSKCAHEVVELSDGEVGKGSAYVILRRLSDKGLVDITRTTRPHNQPGMLRPHYSLNPTGVQTLRDLLVDRIKRQHKVRLALQLLSEGVTR